MKSKGSLKLVVGIGLVAVMVVAIPLVSGCTSSAPTPGEVEPIKIGCPVPLTGLMAADGIEAHQAAILAVEEINAAGGVLGRPLELIVTDTKGFEPDIIRSGAEELMAAGVDMVVTCYFFGPLDIHTYGKYDVPYYHANTQHTSTYAVRDNLPEYSNVFATDPFELTYGPMAAWNMIDMLPAEFGYEHPNTEAAIMTMDMTYCEGISQSFREALAERDWTVTVDTKHAMGTTEFGVELAAIREAKPAILFFSTAAISEGVALTNQFLTDPIDALVYIQYAPTNPEFRNLLGDNATGLVWQVCVGWLPPPLDQGFRERYIERWGAEPAYCATVNTYDPIYHWKEAVELVGDPTDYDAICETSLGLVTIGASGTTIYDPVLQQAIPGNADVGIPNHFVQIWDGQDVKITLNKDIVGEFQVPPWFSD